MTTTLSPAVAPKTPLTRVNSLSPFFFGAVLLAASILKGYQLVTQPAVDFDLPIPRWFFITLVEFELFLGLWLLSGLYKKLARLTALFCFTIFAGVSLYQGFSGSDSCGCFGEVRISPWYTLLFDLIALAALWSWHPAEGRCAIESPLLGRTAIWMALFLLVCIPSTLVLIRTAPATLSAEGDILGDSYSIVLQPESWVRQRFPLFRHIDLGDKLSRGSWILMFHRRDCPLCREAVPRYVGLAYELADRAGAPQVALIEVPPFEGETKPPAAKGAVCARGRLSEAKHWVIKTPWFVALKEGEVLTASQSPDVLLANPFGLPLASAPLANRSNGDESAKGILFPNYRKARRELFLREIACGPLSLIAILQNLDVPLTPEDIDKIISAAGSRGTDLLQLKELAESYGLSALGVAVSPRKLQQMEQQAIVFLDKIGFAAVIGFTPDGPRIVYPMKQPGIVPDDLFERSFGQTGYALLLSRNALRPGQLGLGPAEAPEAQAKGPFLRLSRSTLSVGRIHRRHWEANLTFSNAGTEALRINNVKATCPCIKATVDDDCLQPGQSTTLRAKGEQDALGPFLYAIILDTNQPDTISVEIPVRGYLEHPVGFDKPTWLIQGLLPGQTAQTEVPLDPSPGIDPGDLLIEIPEKAPLTAEINGARQREPVLELRWKGEVKPGWHHYTLGLKVKTVEDGAVSPFQVAIQVVPEIDADPPRILIRDEEVPKTWSRRLTFTFRRKFEGRYTAGWSDPLFAKHVQVEKLDSHEDHLILSISPSSADATKQLVNRQAELLLQLPEDGSCAVPVNVGTASFTKAALASAHGKEGKK